jgi:hypothetical protein
MKVFVFGSCRVWNLLARISVSIVNHRTLMHDISQFIQEVKNYRREITIPVDKYALMYYSNYATHLKNNPEVFLSQQNQSLNEANVVIVEISTLKFIKEDGIYLDLLKAPNHQYSKYTKEAFMSCVEEFVKLIPNKKIVFVGHIFIDGVMSNHLKVRAELNTWVKTVTNTGNGRLYFFDPSIVIQRFGYPMMMSDSSHYTKAGEKIMRRELKKFLFCSL